MCCCQKQLYIAKLAIATACSMWRRRGVRSLQIRKLQTRRRDFTLYCKTDGQTRSGALHSTMNFAKYTEILMKNKIQSPISHNMGPYFIEIREFRQVWPCFGLIFGLFWPFCGGNALFADFRSRLPDCNRSMRRRRWRLWQNFCTFWH